MPPLLLVHVAGGAVGLLSGRVGFHKGSRWHPIAGSVFFVPMLTISGTGVFPALLKSQASIVFGGALTFYLVPTRMADDALQGREAGPVRLGRVPRGIGAQRSDHDLRR